MKEIVIALLTTMINSIISYPTDTINKNDLIRGLEIDLDYIADIQEEPREDKSLGRYIRELEDENENLKASNRNITKGSGELYRRIINKDNEIHKLRQAIIAEKAEREKQIVFLQDLAENLHTIEGEIREV